MFSGHLQSGQPVTVALNRDPARQYVFFNLPGGYRPRGTDQWMVSVRFQIADGAWSKLNGEWSANIICDDHVEVAFDSSAIDEESPPAVTAAIKIPPLWVNVLSRHGYWPVASVQREGFPELAKPEVSSGFEHPTGVWKFLFLAVSVFALAYSAAVLRGPSGGGSLPVYAPPYLSAQANAGQGSGWYVLVATLSLSFVYGTLIAPVACCARTLSGAAEIASAVLFAAVMLGLFAAAVLTLNRSRGRGRV